jgi:hypothetical protein
LRENMRGIHKYGVRGSRSRGENIYRIRLFQGYGGFVGAG